EAGAEAIDEARGFSTRFHGRFHQSARGTRPLRIWVRVLRTQPHRPSTRVLRRLDQSGIRTQPHRSTTRPPTVHTDLELHSMKRRVLIVDDDPAILEVLEMRLAAMGFDVTATPEAHRAMEFATSRLFDVALLDLRMSPLDGI